MNAAAPRNPPAVAEIQYSNAITSAGIQDSYGEQWTDGEEQWAREEQWGESQDSRESQDSQMAPVSASSASDPVAAANTAPPIDSASMPHDFTFLSAAKIVVIMLARLEVGAIRDVSHKMRPEMVFCAVSVILALCALYYCLRRNKRNAYFKGSRHFNAGGGDELDVLQVAPPPGMLPPPPPGMLRRVSDVLFQAGGGDELDVLEAAFPDAAPPATGMLDKAGEAALLRHVSEMLFQAEKMDRLGTRVDGGLAPAPYHSSRGASSAFSYGGASPAFMPATSAAPGALVFPLSLGLAPPEVAPPYIPPPEADMA